MQVALRLLVELSFAVSYLLFDIVDVDDDIFAVVAAPAVFFVVVLFLKVTSLLPRYPFSLLLPPSPSVSI